MPVLGPLGRRFALSTADLVLVYCMLLMAVTVPTWGLMSVLRGDGRVHGLLARRTAAMAICCASTGTQSKLSGAAMRMSPPASLEKPATS